MNNLGNGWYLWNQPCRELKPSSLMYKDLCVALEKSSKRKSSLRGWESEMIDGLSWYRRHPWTNQNTWTHWKEWSIWRRLTKYLHYTFMINTRSQLSSTFESTREDFVNDLKPLKDSLIGKRTFAKITKTTINHLRESCKIKRLTEELSTDNSKLR